MTFNSSLDGKGPVYGNSTLLVVEDMFLIADEAQDLLLAAGAKAVALAADVAEALELLAHTQFDAALVDINLGNQSGLKLGEELHRRGIPFVFSTGYGREALQMPAALIAAPLLSKPYTAELLLAMLAQALAGRRDNSGGAS